jgi:hypothetical protein
VGLAPTGEQRLSWRTKEPGTVYFATDCQEKSVVDEQRVFAYLQKQKKAVLLDYLRDAFGQMTDQQRQAVFADCTRPTAKTVVDGNWLHEEIDQFRRASLARQYYAPFNMNSKNYMHVPEETREWCARFAEFVADVMHLTAHGQHAEAVSCSALLFALLEAVDRGEEIFFAEEAGSWMIPTDLKAWLRAYLTSLAATATAEQFAAAAVPLIEYDSHHSFANQVGASALQVANPQQKAHLQKELQRRKVRTENAPKG